MVLFIDDDLKEQPSKGNVCVSTRIASHNSHKSVVNIQWKDYEIYVHEIASWVPSIKKLDDNSNDDSKQHCEYSEDEDKENGNTKDIEVGFIMGHVMLESSYKEKVQENVFKEGICHTPKPEWRKHSGVDDFTQYHNH